MHKNEGKITQKVAYHIVYGLNICLRFVLTACVQVLERPLVVGDLHYVFVCSTCNLGTEFLRRISLKW